MVPWRFPSSRRDIDRRHFFPESRSQSENERPTPEWLAASWLTTHPILFSFLPSLAPSCHHLQPCQYFNPTGKICRVAGEVDADGAGYFPEMTHCVTRWFVVLRAIDLLPNWAKITPVKSKPLMLFIKQIKKGT